MTILKMVFARMFDYWLDQSRIIKDLIKLAKNLQASVTDLTKACTALAKLEMENRDAIMELYNLHAEVLTNLPAKAEAVKVAKTKLTPIEQVVADKKKNTSN